MIKAEKGEVHIASQHPLGTKEARAELTAELATIYMTLADEYDVVEALHMMHLAALAFANHHNIKIGE